MGAAVISIQSSVSVHAGVTPLQVNACRGTQLVARGSQHLDNRTECSNPHEV